MRLSVRVTFRLLICMAFTLSLGAGLHAATPQLNINLSNPNALNQALAVQWQQSSISMPQLQNLMAGNPGFSLYNIQFPNGSSLALTPSQLQSLSQEAKQLGYKGTDLSFSSLQSGVSNAVNSIPISQLTDPVNGSIDAALRDLRYQQMHLSDWLPDWLKSGILWVWNALSATWDFMVQKYHEYV